MKNVTKIQNTKIFSYFRDIVILEKNHFKKNSLDHMQRCLKFTTSKKRA